MKILNSLTTFLLVLFMGAVQAQEDEKVTVDRLMMVDGDEKVGKVIATKGTDITFQAENDTANTMIPKEEILTIHYSDGRVVQVSIGSVNRNSETWEAKMLHCKNKVAVLPFVYTDEYSKHETGNMSVQAQMDCIVNIDSVNDVLEIQSADSTIALLARNDINWENIRRYIPAELASMLNVEYVVLGTVEIVPIGKKNEKADEFGTENQTLETPQGHKEGVAISEKKFETIVDLNIYNILGETVYTNAQQSLWQTTDAYNINLKYLVEESPFNMK